MQLSDVEAQRLSKMLFEAREEIEMWAEVVEIRTGRRAASTCRVLERIDGFRQEQGWSRHGFGGEVGSQSRGEG